MPLNEGTDYLYFPKVDVSKQSVTATMTRGCAVCTPDAIYVVPVQSFGSAIAVNFTTKYGFGGKDANGAVEQLLADPEMDKGKLEGMLQEMLGDDKTRWVFPLDQLEKFKMGTGFFGQATLKMPGESVRRMVIRGKGGKAKAKDFYKGRL